MLEKFQLKRKQQLNLSLKLIVLSALASGLYPLIYLYASNFALISSIEQFLYFLVIFLVYPILFFIVIKFMSQLVNLEIDKRLLIFTFLNFSVCLCLILYGTNGFSKKTAVILIAISFLLAFFLKNYLDRVVKFQFLLAFVGFLFLTPTLMSYVGYDQNWYAETTKSIQPKLKAKPNIYLIQPDGYIGFSQVNRGFYNYDNSNFKSYLQSQNFNIYPNYRSNYYSTLTSNSSLFTMSHHYYGYNSSDREFLFARNIIVGENPVLSILKDNGYDTNLILENGFLLVNRPEVAYDYCNISIDDVPMLSDGFSIKKDISADLMTKISKTSENPQFYFIERIFPGHISTYEHTSKGKETERLDYIKALEDTNKWLMEVVGTIAEKDPKGLIIIAADHGGFVGYDYSAQSIETPKTDDHVYSIFSSLLAVKWPSDETSFEDELLSSVNLFRVLFSYLSKDSSILETLQDDNSYLKINDNTNNGLFEVWSDDKVKLKKLEF